MHSDHTRGWRERPRSLLIQKAESACAAIVLILLLFLCNLGALAEFGLSIGHPVGSVVMNHKLQDDYEPQTPGRSRRESQLLALSETPANIASACQCLTCGTRLPDWISEAYGSLTQRTARTFDFGTRVSAGCTLLTNTSRVNQLGRSDGFQFRMACFCNFWVADRFARNSGRCAVLRPWSKFLRVNGKVQFPQRRRSPLPSFFPQPGQRRSILGTSTVGKDGRPFASRRCCWVSGVGSERADLRRDVSFHSAPATYSAHGATSLPQVGAVSHNLTQRWDVSRQFPVTVSKKSLRRNGSRITQLSTQSSK
jgi:hypothetical protein